MSAPRPGVATVRSPAEQAVLAALNEEQTVRRLRELIAVPTVTGSAAESEGQALVAGWLTELGLDVDHWRLDLPELTGAVDFPGIEAPRDEGWGLVGTLPAVDGGPPALALSGHLDVVPPGNRADWTGDPFAPVLRAGAVFGRGACDMKGGLVAALAAVTAVVRSGVELPGGLALHSVVGEEDGGLGSFATLRRGHRAAVCVIPEPTDGALVTANAGALGFRLEVPGRSAHGAARTHGISAVERFADVHRALLALEARRNADPDPRFAGQDLPYALSVGTVRAGDWASTVPDLLVAEGRYGVRLGEPVPAARAAFAIVLADLDDAEAWTAAHPVRVGWTGGQFASGAVPAGHPWPGTVATAVADVTGARPAERAAPYGSDLRLYTAAGIPTVHYGPGRTAHAHAPDEHVEIADVLAVARVLALLAIRTAAAAGDP